MKIQANELMIGDWVLHDREPYQIRQLGIYGVDRDGEDYAAVCVGKPNGVGLIVERNEIEPIPITTEILKKNGFVQDGESWWYQDFRIVLSTSKGESLVCGRQVKFCYIHQLQHALRLCRTEKEVRL